MMPFYLEKDLGLTPNWVGLVIMISSVMVMILSPMAGKLSDRTDPLNISLVAMGIGVPAFIYFWYIAGFLNLWLVVVYVFFSGVMTGLFISPNNSLIMGMATKGNYGIVSATYNTASSVAAVLGVSIYQMIFTISTGGDKATPTVNESVNGIATAYLAGGMMILLAFFLSLSNKKNTTRSKSELAPLPPV
jgi:MFS family permease